MVFWTGEVSTAFGNPANWVTDEPGQPHRLPAAGDDVYFSAYGGSTQGRPSRGGPEGAEGPLGPLPENHVDCVGFYGGQYKSVTVDVTYNATVYLAGAVGTGVLNLEGGAISQPTSGTDITVSPFGSIPGAFNWQGGVLNSSTNLATVHIIGAAASINPGGTLRTGSTLSFEDESECEIGGGTLEVANAADLMINDNSIVYASGIHALFFYTHALSSKFVIGYAGTLNLPNTTSQLPVLNQAGTLLLKSGDDTMFTGMLWLDMGGGPPFAAGSVYQINGTTSIASGGTLRVTNGMWMNGGTLKVDPGTGGISSIFGNFKMSAGTLHYQVITNVETGAAVAFGQLKVWKLDDGSGGNVNWTGGIYKPVIDLAMSGNNSFWIAEGTFTTYGAATLTQFPIRGPGVVGRFWTVIGGGGGITGAPPTPNNYTLTLEGMTELKLTFTGPP